MKTKFVEEIPRTLEQGVVYVSMTIGVVCHSCFCGCGHETITPLSPIEWKLQYDGESISLYPSINNWAARCRSHYWIRDGDVIWAPPWTDEEIEKGKDRQAKTKVAYYSREPGLIDETETRQARTGFWKVLLSWFK